MRYSIRAGAAHKNNAECVVAAVWSKGVLTDEARELDEASGKAVSRLVRSGDFGGGTGETALLYHLPGIAARRVLLVGAGERKRLNAANAARMLDAALKALDGTRAAGAHFALGSIEVADRGAGWLAERLAQAGELHSYRYSKGRGKKNRPMAAKAISLAPAPDAGRERIEEALRRGQVIGRAVNRARRLGDLPGNVCTPSRLAEEALALDRQYRRIDVEVLDEKAMRKLGMHSLLSVSAGSAEEAKLILIHYRGAPEASRPYALVGKGITFDTGGISLKPGRAMDEMKFDMCGAAGVIGALAAAAGLKLPINVVGAVAAAENMPSGAATKPGDVVTSMSGKTIEILNTDAEGRLVLCDALTYVERYKPRSVIDIATLTGAAAAALDSHASVLLGNDQALADALLDCGEAALDRAWQLPLWDEYQRQLDSNFADMANIGGPRAGAITAACFLSRFAEKQKWAHLDIAGSAWRSGARKGATGRPVPLLTEYLSRQRP